MNGWLGLLRNFTLHWSSLDINEAHTVAFIVFLIGPHLNPLLFVWKSPILTVGLIFYNGNSLGKSRTPPPC